MTPSNDKPAQVSDTVVPTVRCLDLFCCAGGAGEGYRRAGFDVTGVDIRPQPRNPHRFIQGDALEYLREHGHEFDFIHASPPCQGYTTMNNRRGKDNTPRLIAQVRALLEQTGKPWIIENVMGARSHMNNPVMLTGEMFGLAVHRPRLFESNFFILGPTPPRRQKNVVAVYGKNDGRRLWTRADGSELRCARLPEAKAAMEIDWMEWDEIKEAIPPAYTEFLGKHALSHLTANAEAHGRRGSAVP